MEEKIIILKVLTKDLFLAASKNNDLNDEVWSNLIINGTDLKMKVDNAIMGDIIEDIEENLKAIFLTANAISKTIEILKEKNKEQYEQKENQYDKFIEEITKGE